MHVIPEDDFIESKATPERGPLKQPATGSSTAFPSAVSLCGSPAAVLFITANYRVSHIVLSPTTPCPPSLDGWKTSPLTKLHPANKNIPSCNGDSASVSHLLSDFTNEAKISAVINHK